MKRLNCVLPLRISLMIKTVHLFPMILKVDDFILSKSALVAQLGRALSWYDRDRWFESSPGLRLISIFFIIGWEYTPVIEDRRM
jgi:hypothetical protein